ncbi:hypothetical protein S40288_00762 [Stachybotrys chartarum IBT 40288]|nr:hypothetical protein S40288_00762 [Stachybotrys chartarum IBT 40288]
MVRTRQTLCPECEKVDLAAYFRQEIHVSREATGAVGPSQDAVLLKSLADAYNSAKTCELCRILLAAVCKNFVSRAWTTPEDYLARVSAFVKDPGIYLYSYMHAEDCRSLTQGGDKQDMAIYQSFRLGIGLSTAMDVFPAFRLAGTLQLVQSSCESLSLNPDFHGRIINAERADMRLARRWLDECLSEHGSLCHSSSAGIDYFPVRSKLKDLRVIDVDRMCLCVLPHSGKYVALSYRWASSSENFTTTTARLKELEAEDALRHHFHQIPQTIQDAMDCVRELGEKFLWVDALCIIQDSPEDKDYFIQQMDQIYENALVTIIAAPPSEEHGPPPDGLPGYRAGTRLFTQERAFVNGLDICTSFPCVDMFLARCPWDSRAWTFQEEQLSTRRLYFTASQVYFQCACGVFCEDVVGEGKSKSAYIYRLSSLWNLAGLYAAIDEDQRDLARGLPRTKFQTRWESLEYYQYLVERYTLRDMTNKGDVLIALRGVLTVLRETMGTEFLYGLPEAHFDDAILWVTRQHCKRRQAVSNDLQRKRFPSWAWSGWDGPASYRGHSVGSIRAEVQWFLISEDGHIARLAISPPRDYSPGLLEGLGPGNDNLLIGQLNLEPRSSIRPEDAEVSSLACLSSTAIFRLLGDTLPERHQDWPKHKIFVISGAQDSSVGAIWMEDSWSDRLKNQVEFEFMLLSRSEAVEFVPELDQSMFPAADWSYFNVMLIERRGGHVERLGIGVIHEKAWIAALPTAAILYLR